MVARTNPRQKLTPEKLDWLNSLKSGDYVIWWDLPDEALLARFEHWYTSPGRKWLNDITTPDGIPVITVLEDCPRGWYKAGDVFPAIGGSYIDPVPDDSEWRLSHALGFNGAEPAKRHSISDAKGRSPNPRRGRKPKIATPALFKVGEVVNYTTEMWSHNIGKIVAKHWSQREGWSYELTDPQLVGGWTDHIYEPHIRRLNNREREIEDQIAFERSLKVGDLVTLGALRKGMLPDDIPARMMYYDRGTLSFTLLEDSHIGKAGQVYAVGLTSRDTRKWPPYWRIPRPFVGDAKEFRLGEALGFNPAEECRGPRLRFRELQVGQKAWRHDEGSGLTTGDLTHRPVQITERQPNFVLLQGRLRDRVTLSYLDGKRAGARGHYPDEYSFEFLERMGPEDRLEEALGFNPAAFGRYKNYKPNDLVIGIEDNMVTVKRAPLRVIRGHNDPGERSWAWLCQFLEDPMRPRVWFGASHLRPMTKKEAARYRINQALGFNKPAERHGISYEQVLRTPKPEERLGISDGNRNPRKKRKPTPELWKPEELKYKVGDLAVYEGLVDSSGKHHDDHNVVITEAFTKRLFPHDQYFRVRDIEGRKWIITNSTTWVANDSKLRPMADDEARSWRMSRELGFNSKPARGLSVCDNRGMRVNPAARHSIADSESPPLQKLHEILCEVAAQRTGQAWLRRVKLKHCALCDKHHKEESRSYCHTNHYPGVVCYAKAAAQLGIEWQLGLLAHELGHAFLMANGKHKHTERDANEAGGAVTGLNVIFKGDQVLEYARVPKWLERAIRG